MKQVLKNIIFLTIITIITACSATNKKESQTIIESVDQKEIYSEIKDFLSKVIEQELNGTIYFIGGEQYSQYFNLLKDFEGLYCTHTGYILTGFNLILDSQDPSNKWEAELLSAEVTKIYMDKTPAEVVATISIKDYDNEPCINKFTIIKENGRWCIDDIYFTQNQSSIKSKFKDVEY